MYLAIISVKAVQRDNNYGAGKRLHVLGKLRVRNIKILKKKKKVKVELSFCNVFPKRTRTKCCAQRCWVQGYTLDPQTKK